MTEHLPDRVGEPLADWPTVAPLPAAAPVELYGERQAVVYVPGPYGDMVPVLRDLLPAQQATPPRDLTPQPLFDPRAQILVGGGALAAGAGWGVAQVLSALAAGGTAALMWLALAILAAKLPAAGRGTVKGGDTYHVTNNHNRWWGRSTTRH